ncbi:MAG: hypothetical protein M3019_03850 [Candidatus Dormibacteraeota bacterium]|nr:hypothetical protein [Candidatus Dormibacteraeota bacterium]
MPETMTRVCAAHGVETRLQCAECGDPICLRCQVRTEVGLKCPRCAALPDSAVPRRRWANGMLAAGLGAVVIAVVALVVVLRVLPASPTRTAPPPPPPVGHWRALPDLAVIRGGTSAVLVHGRVLAVGGGIGAIPLAGSELFDPATQSWSPSGNLHDARRGNSTVILPDGRVFTAGGISSGVVLASAEVWDPLTGQWAVTAPMHQARFNNILEVLNDGRVLAAGGTAANTTASLASAEIYDPRANTWTETGPLLTSRSDAAAVRLGDGRILVVGGFTEQQGSATTISSAEIYDPVVGVFTRVASMQQARQDFTLTGLSRGRVLASGGSAGSDALASAEVFDPATGGWTPTGSMGQPRRLQSASVLPDGEVLVAGGEFVSSGQRSSLTSAELYQPDLGQWRPAASMSCPRSAQAQVTLPMGSVIVIAGDAAFPGQPPQAQGCSELYTR